MNALFDALSSKSEHTLAHFIFNVQNNHGLCSSMHNANRLQITYWQQGQVQEFG